MAKTTPSTNPSNATNPYLGDWASDYDENRFTTANGLAFDRLEREQLIRAMVGVEAGSKVLEVGCGTGRFFSDLIERGMKVTGVEPSEDMLNVVREKYSGVELDLVQGAGQSLPFGDDHFDFVYSIRVLNQMGDKLSALQMLSEIMRVVKPGGTVLIEFANLYRPGAWNSSNGSVRLTFSELKHEISSIADVDFLDERGILILSQSLLEKIPSSLVPSWIKLDNTLSRLFTNLTARGYLTFRTR